mgnify:FL=1
MGIIKAFKLGFDYFKYDEDGNVEIVSKNFKMKPTQKLAEQPSSEGDTWICWGCGQPTDQDICPVCGKKRTK